MKIFLVGFMGCGKTTVGKKLAHTLAFAFEDLDTVIEKNAGISIPQIFESHGEEGFREMEARCLKEFNTKRNVVISTGGGTPCFFQNMEWIKANGKSIYLKATPEFLVSRLKGGKEKRPLLKNLAEEEILPFIREKLKHREMFYKQADHTISAMDVKVDEVVKLLEPTNGRNSPNLRH